MELGSANAYTLRSTDPTNTLDEEIDTPPSIELRWALQDLASSRSVIGVKPQIVATDKHHSSSHRSRAEDVF